MLPKAKAPTANALTASITTGISTTESGRSAEDAALAYLLARGMSLVARNYKTPGRGGGEIDLILIDQSGTLVFVEVRRRLSSHYGGAAASVGFAKQRRLIFAAQRFLLRYRNLPPCRFDVIAIDDGIEWIKAAFDSNRF